MSVGVPHAGRDLATADDAAEVVEQVAPATAPVLAPPLGKVSPILRLLGSSPKVVMATVDLLCTITAWFGGAAQDRSAAVAALATTTLVARPPGTGRRRVIGAWNCPLRETVAIVAAFA